MSQLLDKTMMSPLLLLRAPGTVVEGVGNIMRGQKEIMLDLSPEFSSDVASSSTHRVTPASLDNAMTPKDPPCIYSENQESSKCHRLQTNASKKRSYVELLAHESHAKHTESGRKSNGQLEQHSKYSNTTATDILAFCPVVHAGRSPLTDHHTAARSSSCDLPYIGESPRPFKRAVISCSSINKKPAPSSQDTVATNSVAFFKLTGIKSLMDEKDDVSADELQKFLASLDWDR